MKLPTLPDTPRERYQAWRGKIDTSGLDPVLATVNEESPAAAVVEVSVQS